MQSTRKSGSQAGMTLIEIVIVITIVALLAAIAIPSYGRYVTRSQRADAKSALLALATAQEKFFTQCNTYATGIGAANDCAAREVAFSETSERGWYRLSVVAADTTATTFGVRADVVAGGPQAKDTACTFFAVTDRGQRTASGDECWP